MRKPRLKILDLNGSMEKHGMTSSLKWYFVGGTTIKVQEHIKECSHVDNGGMVYYTESENVKEHENMLLATNSAKKNHFRVSTLQPEKGVVFVVVSQI